jgi:hypothetical protein
MRSDLEIWKATRRDGLAHGLSQRDECLKYNMHASALPRFFKPFFSEEDQFQGA